MKNNSSSSEKLHESFFGHEHMTVIEPAKSLRMFNLSELWAYRELLWVLTLRDIKVRYKQTVLGVAWAIIQPVMTMIVFSIVFGKLAKMPSDGYPYPVFVYAALLPWTFFSNATSASSGSVVGSAHLVSKVYFPRLIIPLSSVGAGLIDMAISMCILVLLMLFYGMNFGFNLFAVPFLLIAVVFTALGVGTFLSALTVAYRDFRYVIPFLLQIWLYATPVVYSVNLVPDSFRWLININPMAGFIEGFRAAFLGKSFDLFSLAISCIFAIVFFLIGIFYFEKVERRFADII
jgi:lipopolysaccharide transport system permease protein